MRKNLTLFALTAVFGFAVAAPTEAQMTFNSDTDAVNWMNALSFEQGWVAEARAGNDALNGDWEVGLGNDTQDPSQFTSTQWNWDEEGNHAFTALEYSGGTAFFAAQGASASYGIGNDPSWNVILFRAKAADGRSELYDVDIEFADGSSYFFDSNLVGDSDAQWWAVVTPSVAGGFTVDGQAYFETGELMGSNTAYEMKVGYVTPEPASLALLGTGLVGLLGVAYRRRQGADIESG